MEKDQSNGNGKSGIVTMFRQSIAPYSKKLVALHPHLYGSLYRRASEIQALDKILIQLNTVREEAKHHRYDHLLPILEAIKDALHGQPELSWWTHFTTSVGYAFGTTNNQTKNTEEIKYLTAISSILTEIIREYHSSNTKLLLDVRLTALEVDARLVELDKIPEGVQEVNETFDYLTSEFQLLIQELENIVQLPKDSWIHNSKSLLHSIEKTNNLMNIVVNIEQTDLATFQTFEQSGYIQKLEKGIGDILKEYILIDDPAEMAFWQTPQLNTFFTLFNYFPNLIFSLRTKELCTFLQQTERLFISDTTLDKKRPNIFQSAPLKDFVNICAETCQQRFETLRAISKGLKIDRSISNDLRSHLKQHFMMENDLHHICALVLTKPMDPVKCDSVQIQKEIVQRMVALSNASQPKDLDVLLKSFSDHEKENRYFLIQEIILEQFIRWRKIGIY